ncbi:MAG: hypothetical protein RL717_1787 [Pseudomonadota bacterium]|jgi:hypothetical protein
MKFAHLIEINVPGNPLIAPLSRAQLWHGLVMRAERPTLFVIGLDRCTIVERSVTGMARELAFGPLVIHDQVHFLSMEKVHYHVPQQNDIPASDLTMTIEEPSPGALFVRFEYDDHTGDTESSEEAFYNEFRRSAYLEADIDTIRMIRQLADEGQLDAPLQ